MSEKNPDKIPVGAKRSTKKKPKDKPKRPLSAYNYFFKEERQKILKIVLADDPYKVEQDPDSADFLTNDMIASLKKEGNKVSFEHMGKIIGARWKNIDPDRLTKYSELATEDTERYKKEMQSYNGRQEEKMRSEALKPQPSYGPPRGRDGMPTTQDPRSAYPEMNPGYAQGYGYDPYGYSMYGGYGYSYSYPPPPTTGGDGQGESPGRGGGQGADQYAAYTQQFGYPP